MKRDQYKAFMTILTNKKNEKLLPDNSRSEFYELRFKTGVSHKAGVYIIKSLNDKIYLKIESMGFKAPEKLILFNKLEQIIFDFLDTQENTWDEYK